MISSDQSWKISSLQRGRGQSGPRCDASSSTSFSRLCISWKQGPQLGYLGVSRAEPSIWLKVGRFCVFVGWRNKWAAWFIHSANRVSALYLPRNTSGPACTLSSTDEEGRDGERTQGKDRGKGEREGLLLQCQRLEDATCSDHLIT